MGFMEKMMMQTRLIHNYCEIQSVALITDYLNTNSSFFPSRGCSLVRAPLSLKLT